MLKRAWMLGGAGVLALFAQQSLGQDQGWRGLGLYIVAAVLFALAVTRKERTQRHTSSVGLREWPKEAQQALIGAGLLIVLLFVIVDPEQLTGSAWILQAAALALVITAAWYADGAPRSQLALPKSPLDVSTATTQLVLAIIVIGGIWVRFRNLGSTPQGFWFDEADVALLARRIADEGFRPIFDGREPAYDAYLIALMSKVFGEGMATVRAVSAVFGTVTILAGYLVGRELFGKMGGLVLAFLVAFSRWSVTLSRIGMNNVTLPLFTLLTLGFLLRGHRRQSNVDYALAGISAGCGMLFYSAIASSIIALGLFALFVSWATGQDKRSLGPQVLIAVVAAAAVVAPLLRFIAHDSERYFSRNANTAIWSSAGRLDNDTLLGAFKDSLSRYLPMTHYNGDRNGRHNIPGEPMLPPLVAGLSFLGLGTVLFRTDKWLTVLGLAWIPLAFAPGVLSLPWEAPNSLRAVAVQPIALIIATAAVFALARSVVTSQKMKYGMLALLVVAIGGTGLADVNSYFSSNANRSDVWAVHSTGETLAASLTADAPDSTYVQAAAFLRDSRQLRYLGSERREDDVFGSETQLPLFVPEGKDALLLATRDSFDIGAQAERFYANAEIQREFNGLTPDLVVVRVPAADIADSLGWTESQNDDGLPVRTGVLIIDEAGPYRFRMSGAVDRLIINGFEMAACDADSAVPLAAGIHYVEIVGDTSTTLQWFSEDDVDWSDVPADHITQDRLLPGGLRTTHTTGLDTGAAADLYEIDAGLNLRMHEFVLPRPYQTMITGGLVVPASGDYQFDLRTDDPLILTIGDTQVFSTTGDFINTSEIVSLSEGTLPISVQYQDINGRSEIRIKWRPASSDQEPSDIPQNAFVPWFETQRWSDC